MIYYNIDSVPINDNGSYRDIMYIVLELAKGG
jgi:hypothetical protein